jgi:hypothetical protein
MRNKVMSVIKGAALVAMLAGLLGMDAPSAVPLQQTCVPREDCCKVCDKGKACGNSCISRAKNCHKGRGCACDAAEICD